MSGFIALHRMALDHPLFKEDVARLGAWCWMVARACWKETRFDINGKVVTLQRGQFVASRNFLAKAWGWSDSAVERFLTRLQTEQMIGRETGQGRSIITICNYAKYQDISDESGQATEQASGQPSDSHRTAKEQGNKGTSISSEANASSDSAPEQFDLPAPAQVKRPKSEQSFVLPANIPSEEWQAYDDMRRRIRKPMTDYAKRLAVTKLNELAEHGHPPGAVLNQSTLNGWQGLFPLKDNGNGTTSHHHETGFARPGSRADEMDRAHAALLAGR